MLVVVVGAAAAVVVAVVVVKMMRMMVGQLKLAAVDCGEPFTGAFGKGMRQREPPAA